MKKVMKRLSVAMLIIAILLMTVGCGAAPKSEAPAADAPAANAPETKAPEAAADKKITVAFANMADNQEFCQSVKKGIEDEAKKKGWEIYSMDNAMDGAKAVANAKNVATLGVDFFFEFNPDSQAGEAIMEVMNEAGIPTIAIDIPLPGAPYFGANNYEAGKVGGVTAGEIAQKQWGAVDYVVMVTRPDGGELMKQREDGFFDGVKTLFPDIPDENLIILDGKGDVLPAKQAFTDFLTAHPDAKHIVVGGCNDQCGQGALAATETSNRSEDVLIVSQGCDQSALDNLYLEGENSWKGSVSYAPELYGSYLIPLAEKAINGEELPADNYLDHFTITEENVNDYYPQK